MAELTFRMEPPSTLWVGAVPYRWAQLEHVDHGGVGYPFRLRRAYLPFENGWAWSIVWGDYTYSSNRRTVESEPLDEEPTHVEMALLHHDHGLVDDVFSMVGARVANEWIAKVMALPSELPIEGALSWMNI